MKKVPVRRSDTEKIQVGRIDDGIRRYYDHNAEHTVVKLMTGDCYVTNEPREMLVTILGSCVSVCMRDPLAGVGGMNHILLPGEEKAGLSAGDPGYCTRFGAFAMEELINGIMNLGGHKDRLEVKVFGGGNVIKNTAMIGTRNVAFVRKFLQNEGLKVISEDVEGDYPRRIHYFPDTGKVMMRKLMRGDDLKIVDTERNYQKQVVEHADDGGDVELFG